MALADVKAYFKDFEQDHIQRRTMLEEANRIASTDGMPEEIINQLRDSFQRDDRDYQFFAHIMWLLALPKRDSKKVKAMTRDQKLMTHFSEFGFDKDSMKLEHEEVLTNFRKYINSLEDTQA